MYNNNNARNDDTDNTYSFNNDSNDSKHICRIYNDRCIHVMFIL